MQNLIVYYCRMLCEFSQIAYAATISQTISTFHISIVLYVKHEYESVSESESESAQMATARCRPKSSQTE